MRPAVNGTALRLASRQVDIITLNADHTDGTDDSTDRAGNFVKVNSYRNVYDAWHRLVKVRASADSRAVTIQTAEFDATGRRIQKVVTNSGDLDATTVYLYHGQQIIETRDGSSNVVAQFIHGTQYIDELVMARITAKGDFYYHQDADFNCVFGNLEGNYSGDAVAGPNDLNVDPQLDNERIHLQRSSPCVDPGDPNLDPLADETEIDNEDRIQNDRLDIGADETPLTACEGDANGDGEVDPLDSGYVLARFDCPVGIGDPSCDAADVNMDGEVNPLDSGFVRARFGECP